MRNRFIFKQLIALLVCIPGSKHCLTLYQTTKLSAGPIKNVCRRQNKCNFKTEILCGMGRKHYGKRRKCWLPAFSPFPTRFSKGFFFRVDKSRDCVTKGQRGALYMIQVMISFHTACSQFNLGFIHSSSSFNPIEYNASKFQCHISVTYSVRCHVEQHFERNNCKNFTSAAWNDSITIWKIKNRLQKAFNLISHVQLPTFFSEIFSHKSLLENSRSIDGHNTSFYLYGVTRDKP